MKRLQPILAIHRLPRVLRITMAMLFAVALVLLIFPVVDDVYVTYFFDPSTVILPSLISVAIGGVYYIIGWLLLVNPRLNPPPSPLPVLLYLLIGIIVLCVDIALITMGINMLDALG
jgi:hypothetical protein